MVVVAVVVVAAEYRAKSIAEGNGIGIGYNKFASKSPHECTAFETTIATAGTGL